MSSSIDPILVLGAHGLLGSRLVADLLQLGQVVLAPTSSEVNLTEMNQIALYLNRYRPNTIINLVALTDVDYCEKNPAEAFLKNAKTVANVFQALRHSQLKTHVVHMSTDQLYEGINPNTETEISLVNYYGYSKYVGELLAEPSSCTIIRSNFFGRSIHSERKSFTDWLFESLILKQQTYVFEDIFFNPISIGKLIEYIIIMCKERKYGVFNVGSKYGCSKADFAFSFAKFLNLDTSNLIRISVDQFGNSRALRPKNMLMDCSKFETTFGLTVPALLEQIEHVATEYYDR